MNVSRFFPHVLLLIVIALFAACVDDEGNSVSSVNERQRRLQITFKMSLP